MAEQHPYYQTYLRREELLKLDEDIKRRRQRVATCKFNLKEAEDSLEHAVRLRESLELSFNPSREKKEELPTFLPMGGSNVSA